MKPPKAVEDSSPSVVAYWRNPGVIYFVAVGAPPVAVKIGVAGITKNHTLRDIVIRRLSQIQSSNHELIHLLGVLHFTEGEYPSRDADIKGRELHNEFNHLCRFKAYRRGAEWFDASHQLLAHIEQIASNPEALELPRH